MKAIQTETISDKEEFKKRRALAWKQNVGYWLAGPLRHVVDVGDYIADRTVSLCQRSDRTLPVVVDMGFGDGWLLRSLLRRRLSCTYIGLDSTQAFIDHARGEFAEISNASFEIVDFEELSSLHLEADVVVNAFNFFELCELDKPFANASQFLRNGGHLQLATIDKTFLMLALSQSFEEFKSRLSSYQESPGTKYFFQPIDLGDGVSETNYYPSVLYSTEDYFSAACDHGLTLRAYKEHPFTQALVPKIYCHYEFLKIDS